MKKIVEYVTQDCPIMGKAIIRHEVPKQTKVWGR